MLGDTDDTMHDVSRYQKYRVTFVDTTHVAKPFRARFS